MKLVISAAILGLASAEMVLQSMDGAGDECAGCDELSPPSKTVCNNPPCDSEVCGRMAIFPDQCKDESCRVDCSLEKGYYRDNANCRGYCFCSGTDNIDAGSGIRVPSRWELCPVGTFWDADCKGAFAELANGMGYAGGCCNHAAEILHFHKCPGSCERLSKYNCAKSRTCAWDGECDCCRDSERPDPSEPEDDLTPTQRQCKGKALDVSFIVDGSGSIGPVNFQASKDFLKKIVANFDLGPTQVSAVQYSIGHAIEFEQLYDMDDLMAAIQDMPYQGKSTRTGKACRWWAKKQTRRQGVAGACMVLTDGVSYDGKKNHVSITGPELQAKNLVIAVGVGKADVEQLEFIASDPDADNMYNSKDWGYLEGIADGIAAKLCGSVVGIENQHGK